MDNIRATRRQQFLYQELYENSRIEQIKNIKLEQENVIASIDDPKYGFGSLPHKANQAFLYHETFWLWMLDYTAGMDIELLAPRLSEVVDLFEEWFNVKKAYVRRRNESDPDTPRDPNAPAPDFYNQIEYEETMQLLGVAIMLRDEKSVYRILDCLSYYRGEDQLFDEFARVYDEQDSVSDEYFHDEPPYDLLVDMMYEEDDEEALKLLTRYLKNWYKHQDGARWFDAHLEVVDDKACYYGYWAFEAGAVAFLIDLDDSSIDHMVYPKDLVAYGKKLKAENRYTSRKDDADKPTFYRVEAQKACTRDGYWWTPAQPNSRRYFVQGEIMPNYPGSSYGSTIWYWDQQQSE